MDTVDTLFILKWENYFCLGSSVVKHGTSYKYLQDIIRYKYNNRNRKYIQTDSGKDYITKSGVSKPRPGGQLQPVVHFEMANSKSAMEYGPNMELVLYFSSTYVQIYNIVFMC